jgi:RND family efflux transporter MFP subunit
MTSVDPDLVKQLRIASDQREPADGDSRPGGRRALVAGSVALVVAVVFGGGWAAAHWLQFAAPAVRTAAVVAAGAGAAPAGAVLQATGYVTARRRATVSTQITGTLTQVLFEEGDRVAAGQVLARLDDAQLRAALKAAQANVQSTQAQVTLAQVQLEQAQADARRSDELVASGMTTHQLAEQARSNVNTLAATLVSRQRLVEAAQAQLAEAQVNVDYTVVRAPFAGVIIDKAAQVGEIVSPLSAGGGFTRTGVGTIVDMDSLEVEVDVNEASIAQVRAGMPCEAVLDAYPDWHIPAHVIAVIPDADRGKATVRVRVALEQKDARVVPDIGVRVSFLKQAAAAPVAGASAPQGVFVPAAALAQRDGHAVVFVAAEGRAKAHAVTPGASAPGALVLLPAAGGGNAELRAGDRVILEPGDALRDGDRVAPDDGAR